MLELVERDFEAFFEAPFNSYGTDSPYISPMKSDLARFLSAKTNPLFASDKDFTYFAVKKDGLPIGRITAHCHRASNKLHDADLAYFGFFDCPNDPDVASMLLGAAEDWARKAGFSHLSGNFNLTAMQQIGIMTEGFENPPFTDQIWGPNHLPTLLEERGYAASFPMTTLEIDIKSISSSRMLTRDASQALADAGFTFAPITRADLPKRLEEARQILNESFLDNPMFVPVSEEEFHFQAKEMKWIMDPRISSMVHCNGELAGAVIVIPDLNPLLKTTRSRLSLSFPWHFLRHRFGRKRAVVIFQGVRPAFQNKGVNPMMLAHIFGQLKKAGYETVGGTWIADSNHASLRQTEKAGAKALHKLHLYSREL